MPLEVATYIHQLVPTNPVGALDQKAQGDDHLRLLKQTLQATFPNIAGAVSITHTQLNALANADIQSFANPSQDIGLSIVNGTAKTMMRSDGAPRLSQAIVPTWTGLHTFNAGIATGPTSDLAVGRNASIANTLSVGGLATVAGLIAAPAAGASVALRNNTNVPYIDFQTAAGAQLAYIQTLSAGEMVLENSQANRGINLVSNGTGTVKYGGIEVGYRGVRQRRDVSGADNTQASDNGGHIRFVGGAGGTTFTLDSDIAVNGIVTMINDSGGSVTISAASGASGLNWPNGVTVVTGNRTLAYGGTCSVLCHSAGVYYIQGNSGLS